MTIGLRGVANAKKLRLLRRWFKRNVLRQPWMLEGFASPFVHEPMLLDKIRCDGYREAIQRTVKPGDVVVDLGAGTGCCRFFALQAGQTMRLYLAPSITDGQAEWRYAVQT